MGLQRFYGVMKVRLGAACGAALLLTVALAAQASAATGFVHRVTPPILVRAHRLPIGERARPWVEGVTPPLENELFDATYKSLPSHNVLKVYVFDTTGFESAGIRISARVPHEARDLTTSQLDHEAVSLIRTTFDQFPQLQTLDIWATIPIPKSEQTALENTVFSVSADRVTYESIRPDASMPDEAFLAAFGQVWVAPEVPR